MVKRSSPLGSGWPETMIMRYKTLEGVLNPDGRVELPPDELPVHRVRVMVTILESGEESRPIWPPTTKRPRNASGRGGHGRYELRPALQIFRSFSARWPTSSPAILSGGGFSFSNARPVTPTQTETGVSSSCLSPR